MPMESFTIYGLLEKLEEAVERYPDTRKGPNLRYALFDGVKGAFSVFVMQCASFLSHQRLMQEAQGRNNAGSLFRINDIPSDPQIRNLLDPLTPDLLFPVFRYCFDGLVTSGILDTFRVQNAGDCLGREGNLLIAFDGTGYFSSDTIHCNSCTKKTHADGHVSYSHSVLTPSVVAPEKAVVIPLEPEYIMPQDGAKKQDCETNAMKRWMRNHAAFYASLGVTTLGDDLYSRQPMCELVLSHGFHFIFVCKRESHDYLYDWVDALEHAGDLKTVATRKWNGKYHEVTTYRFAENVPLRDGDDAMRLQWCGVTVVREEDGKDLYRNAFVSDRIITNETIADVIVWGRSRWKIENEGNNTLKTKGYHFEHNYGHGKKHLSAFLATLILLAFLCHTIMAFASEAYRRLRSKLPTRQMFFHHIEAVAAYVHVDCWDDLFFFMLKGLERPWRFSIAPG